MVNVAVPPEEQQNFLSNHEVSAYIVELLLEEEHHQKECVLALQIPHHGEEDCVYHDKCIFSWTLKLDLLGYFQIREDIERKKVSNWLSELTKKQ